MNNQRRKQLTEIVAKIDKLNLTEIANELEQLVTDLEALKDDEQSAYDNMPESLQQSERGQQSEAAVSALESAHATLEGIKDALEAADGEREDVKNSIEEASTS